MDRLRVEADQAFNTSPVVGTTPRNSARSWPGCDVTGTTSPESGLVSLRLRTRRSGVSGWRAPPPSSMYLSSRRTTWRSRRFPTQSRTPVRPQPSAPYQSIWEFDALTGTTRNPDGSFPIPKGWP